MTHLEETLQALGLASEISLYWPLGHPRGLYSLLEQRPGPELISHDAGCLLNAGDQDAHVAITVFYSDRDPAGPYRFTCQPAARSICASTISPTWSRYRRPPTTLA
jgi:hypothetical protein